jgi:putative oxidoreductase
MRYVILLGRVLYSLIFVMTPLNHFSSRGIGYAAQRLLALFLVPVTLLMHRFWAVQDPVMAQMQLGIFMKNVSMLGGALLIASFGAGPLSLDARARV